MLFSSITGHDTTRRHLLRAVQTNQLAHALLFDGPEGSANLALALSLAQYVNCENKQPDDACGQCASCLKTQKLVHPDLHVVFPVANTDKGKTAEAYLADWRAFVQKQVYFTHADWLNAIEADNKPSNISAEEARTILQTLSLKSYEGGYKIMLIWLPEIMHVSAANALLKVLEEPPAQTLFLLVSNRSDKLLITILSRVQRIGVSAFTDEQIATHLRQTASLDETTARRIAYLSEGSMAEALRLSQQAGPTDQHVWFADWMRLCYRQDLIKLVKQADQFDGFTKEKQKGLLTYSLRICREIFRWQQQATPLLRLPDDELSFVRNFANVLPAQQLPQLVQDLNTATYHLERNARAKMVMLDLSLTFCRLFPRN